jgi:hypothetical protein
MKSYPSDDPEIVANDKVNLHKTNLHLCGYDGWHWPQICKKEKKKGYMDNKLMPCIESRAIS